MPHIKLRFPVAVAIVAGEIQSRHCGFLLFGLGN